MQRLEDFSTALRKELSDAYYSEALGDHTCIYATGSGGRLEMHDGSDLDVFLVRFDGEGSRRQAALLQSAVVRAMDSCHFPPPSQDGRFLALHSGNEFIDLLGTPEDDEQNKLTARMLLLLESRPLKDSEKVYDHLVEQVLGEYWRQSPKRPDDFIPRVLTNDIIRYWRILLLNHESNLRQKSKKRDRKNLTADEKAFEDTIERRRSSYKLRFARCVTCFASLSYLLALVKYEKPPVLIESVRKMVGLTPLERLDAVAAMSGDATIRANVASLRSLYTAFLEDSATSPDEMGKRLADETWWQDHSDSADDFVQGVFDLVMGLQKDNPLFRYVVV